MISLETEDFEPWELIYLLKEAHEENKILTAATGTVSESVCEGIASNHAYSVVDVIKDSVVILRDPRGPQDFRARVNNSILLQSATFLSPSEFEMVADKYAGTLWVTAPEFQACISSVQMSVTSPETLPTHKN